MARVGEERGVYRVLLRKPEGKRPLGRRRRKWVDNIRVDLQEVTDACECGNEPSGSINAGNFLIICKPVSCSRRTPHHGVSKLLTFKATRQN